MFRKLKDFLRIIECNKTAVACKRCKFFNGSVTLCNYQRNEKKTFFYPVTGSIFTSYSTVIPYLANRYGRCPYFEARREE